MSAPYEPPKVLRAIVHFGAGVQAQRLLYRLDRHVGRRWNRRAVEVHDDRDAFGEIAASHAPFEDSRSALSALKSLGLTLGALSNIDERSFAQATERAGISFDVVVTAERVGAYKPDHTHFWAALSDLLALGIPRERVLHVAQSRRADIVPANRIGLSCVWVDRPGHMFGRAGCGAEDARPDWQVSSLADLVDRLE